MLDLEALRIELKEIFGVAVDVAIESIPDGSVCDRVRTELVRLWVLSLPARALMAR